MARAFLSGQGHIHVKTDYHEDEAAKQVPGGRWRPEDRVWRYPLAVSTCHALRGVYGVNLAVDSDLGAWYQAEADRWLKACHWLTDPAVLALPPADAIGPSTLHDAVSAVEDLRSSVGPTLRSFQEVAATQLVLARSSIYASDMGTGKTPTAITALRQAATLGINPYPLLVICPNTLKRNWVREFSIWDPDLQVAVVTGTPTKRRKAIEEVASGAADVAIINYESVRSFSRLTGYGSMALKRCTACGGTDPDLKTSSCEVHSRELNEIKWASVIADEAHRLKDPKSKQTRAAWAVSKAATFRWALTGTPIANTPADLWSLLRFVAPEEWPTRTGYIDRYVEKFFDPFGGVDFGQLLPHTESELRLTLDARLIRHTKPQVLPLLPPKVYEVRTCTLSKVESDSYKDMKKGLIAQVKGGQVIGWNPLTQVGRLLQMANSTVEVVTDADGTETVTPVEPSSKLDLLDETVWEVMPEPVVVFFVSRKLLKLYEARLAGTALRVRSIHGEVPEADREDAVTQFQAGNVDVLLVTTGAGGEGLTLTRSSTVIFAQRPWSLVQSKQAEDRVHRIGSEIHATINVIDLLTEDTVEEKVADTLVTKGENLEGVVRDKAKLLALLS